jgi:hypothetical protein
MHGHGHLTGAVSNSILDGPRWDNRVSASVSNITQAGTTSGRRKWLMLLRSRCQTLLSDYSSCINS